MNEALGIFKTTPKRIVKNSRNFHLKPNLRFWALWNRRFVTYNLEGSRWVSWVCLSWCIWKSEWRSPWVWGHWSLLLTMTPFRFRRDDHTLCHIPKWPLCEHSRSQRWLQAVLVTISTLIYYLFTIKDHRLTLKLAFSVWSQFDCRPGPQD